MNGDSWDDLSKENLITAAYFENNDVRQSEETYPEPYKVKKRKQQSIMLGNQETLMLFLGSVLSLQSSS